MPIRLLTALVLIFLIAPGIALAATFGKTTDGANVQTFSADRIYLSTDTPATSGTITSCWARVRVTSAGTSEMRIVIFADNGGTPNGGAFLGQSDEVIVNWTTSTLTEFVFSTPLAITGATQYWLGGWADDPGTMSYEYKRDNNASVVHFAAEAYPGGGTPTTPFTSGGTANGPHNVYCEYTEASADVASPGLVVKDTMLVVTDGALVKIN